MSDVNVFSLSVGAAFDRAIVGVDVFFLVVSHVMHGQSARADWNAIFVQFDSFIFQMWIDGFAPGIQRDHRVYSFDGEVSVVGIAIVMPVAGEDVHGELLFVLSDHFQESVHGFQREGEVAFVAAGHDDLQGEVVSILSGCQ